MERSELTVFEFWMNDDFQHWRHRERGWHFCIVCALSFTSVFFAQIEMIEWGLAVDLVLLFGYFAAIILYSPLYQKITLSERIKDAFLYEEAGAKARDENTERIPKRFIGPLSKKLMVNPVTTVTGQVYERSMIGRWFAKGNVIDPISKRPMKSLQLKPAVELQKEINEFKSKKRRRSSKKDKKKIKSGWKAGENSETKRILEEVYERELLAMEEVFSMSLDEQEEQKKKERKLKFMAHMVLKRSSTTLDLKNVRLILTSETDPFFNLQEECTLEAYEMIREQYDLVSTFEEFPQLLASMLDRSVDEAEVFKLVITPASGNLEFAQFSIRNITMKGQFSNVLVLNLMPSKYTPQLPWLFIGKLGAIVSASGMVVVSYLLTVKHEALDSNPLENSALGNIELLSSSIFATFIILMLLIYQVVSHRFGTKMHIADENRQILAGKGENDDDEDQNDESILLKSKEKALRAKHKKCIAQYGIFDVKTISAHGDLGIHLVEQPRSINEGIKILRSTLQGLNKAKIGVSNPIFVKYQAYLLKYEKILLENKRKDRKSITHVEEALPDIIEVHSFENNQAQLWGSWFGSHKVYKSKHVCAVFAQRLRVLLILLEGLSMFLLLYAEAGDTGWILAKVVCMFTIQVILLIFIDHNTLFGIKRLDRAALLLFDLVVAGISFIATASIVYALSVLEMYDTVLSVAVLQTLNIVLSGFMLAAILLEMFDKLWLWLIQKCRKRRQTVRKRRNTMKRKSITQHFSGFTEDEMKLDPFAALNKPTRKSKRKSRSSANLDTFDNPMLMGSREEVLKLRKKGIRGSKKVEQKYLNPMLQKVTNQYQDKDDVESVQNVVNPLLALKQRKKSRSSRKSKSRDGESSDARRARREERRSRREDSGRYKNEKDTAKQLRREQRRSRDERGDRDKDGKERRQRRRSRRTESRGFDDEAVNSRREQRQREREKLEKMGMKLPKKSVDKKNKKKKRRKEKSREPSRM